MVNEIAVVVMVSALHSWRQLCNYSTTYGCRSKEIESIFGFHSLLKVPSFLKKFWLVFSLRSHPRQKARNSPKQRSDVGFPQPPGGSYSLLLSANATLIDGGEVVSASFVEGHKKLVANESTDDNVTLFNEKTPR